MNQANNFSRMKDTPLEQSPAPIPLWARTIKRWLSVIEAGSLSIEFPGARSHVIKGALPGPHATITIHSPAFFWKVMTGGNLGFARSYLDGDWESPDIGALLDLGIRNEERIERFFNMPLFAKIVANLRHRRNANTRKGSRRNIAFHYDLGNSFYEQWLDKTMTYSSALFTQPEQSLEEAQTEKYARIVRELGLKPNDRVLEIGCGWGGFAEYTAKTAGCSIVCLTLSQEQARFAKERMDKAGLSDLVEIRIEDYRDCTGQFDKIVSIEMFEAVGEENWPVYFEKLHALLKPDGEAMLQVITMDEKYFDHYRKNADFIQTYIFPGGMLPSPRILIGQASAHGLDLCKETFFGRDYEKTLLAWEAAFNANWTNIAPIGFDDRFKNMWNYYLHYCAAGFRSSRINVGHFHFRNH